MSTAPAGPRGSVPLWVRLALLALGLPNVVTGLWAVVAPLGWYDQFPGFDPRLISAEPPYNAHLATDAGAGLLASGVVLLLGAWLADARSVQLALAAFATFAVPHAAYHVLNPAPGLTTAEDVQNAALLVFTVVATVGLFVAARLSRRRVA
ncbi:MAG: hypothetical protein ACR2JF_17860 [Iamia sp.]